MTAAAWSTLMQRTPAFRPTCLRDDRGPRAGVETAPASAAEPFDDRWRRVTGLGASSSASPLAAGLRTPVREQGAAPVMLAQLHDVESIWARPEVPVSVERLVGFVGERARVTGAVPRYLAEQLAASDDVVPPGDPVVMSFDLVARDDDVAFEGAAFLQGEKPDSPRDPVYAFAETRAFSQALAALLVGASPEVVAASPLVAQAQRALRKITEFEDGPQPASPAMRMVHRAAALQRVQALGIAESLGPIFDCRIDPQLPTMIDEPRERPVAEALLAAADQRVDPALLYAVVSDDGLGLEVERWHRGIDGIEIPDTFDASQALALSRIADEEASLRQSGHLPPWFRSAFRDTRGLVTFVPVEGHSALANGLTFVAARLARGREQALAEATRVFPEAAPAFDARTLTFLTLLSIEGGPAAVSSYLRGRSNRPILPVGADLRADPMVARAFARTALWEQMRATAVFETARP